MLGESFEYTKEGLIGKWMKWILLIIASIIFPLLYGYVVRIYKGESPSPELDDWAGLFIDGIKLLIIGIVYAIPIIIVAFLLIGGAVISAAAMGMSDVAAIAGAGFGLLIVLIFAIIIGLIVPIAYVRFARTGSMGEAFNFSAIIGHIGKIGWISYIIALIILGVVISVIEFILMMIPVLGWILIFILIPAFAIFSARYMSLLYDNASE